MRKMRRVIALILVVFMALGMYRVDVRADSSDESQSYQQGETSGDNAQNPDTDVPGEGKEDEIISEQDEPKSEPADDEVISEQDEPKSEPADEEVISEQDEPKNEPADDEIIPEQDETKAVLTNDKNALEPNEQQGQQNDENQKFGKLTFNNAAGCGGRNGAEAFFFITENEEFTLRVECLTEDGSYFEGVEIQEEDGNFFIDNIPLGRPIRFSWEPVEEYSEFIPLLMIDGEYDVFDNNEYIWEEGFDEADLEKDIDLSVSVEELSVGDMNCYEGIYNDTEVWEDGEIVDRFKSYNTWPKSVYVKLVNGEEFEGDAYEVKSSLVDYFNYPEEALSFWDEADQPAENGMTTWTANNTYPVKFHVLGAETDYSVTIDECPIASIFVEDKNVAEGDLVDRTIDRDDPQTGEHERVDVKAYDIWPNNIRIEFKEDFEHEPIEGWPSEVKTELAGILGFENENDIPYGDDFNASQTYDENNISTWEVGAHEVSFHVFGIETTYKVNVVEVGYTLSVDDVVLFQGNMDDRYGYDIFDEQGNFVDFMDVNWKAYNTYPQTITVSFDDESEPITDDFWRVYDIISEKYGITLSDWIEGDDQSPENEWGVGSHSVTLHLGNATVSYNVIIQESPIAEIRVEDIVKFEGDVREERGYHDPETGEWNNDITYQIYDPWPEMMTVTLSDSYAEAYGSPEISGDPDFVREELMRLLGLEDDRDMNFHWETDQSPDYIFEIGDNTAYFYIFGVGCEYTVTIKPSPIEDLYVDDFQVLQGDLEDREAGRDNPETGEYERIRVKAYKTWPEYVEITLSEDYDNEVISGNPGDVKRRLAEILGYEDENAMSFGEDFDASQEYDENLESTWGPGEHEVRFFALGAEYTYFVTVIEADYTITADDISKYVGETDTRYGYEYFDDEGHRQFVDEEWQAYDPNSRNVTVTFADDQESFTGDVGQVRDYIREKYGVMINDWIEGDDQSPDNEWRPGIHPVTLHIGSASASYNVIIDESPVVEISVDDLIKFEGDTREERGYRDPETGEWDDDITYQIYDPWPQHMTVTLSDSYAEDYGSNEISGDGEYVRRELMNLLGIEDERDIIFYWETDQGPDNIWEPGEEHFAIFKVCGLEAAYKVNILGKPIKSIAVNDIVRFEGDTYPSRDWREEYQQEITWQRYDTWPGEVTINFTDDTSITGDLNGIRDQVNQKLADIAGVDSYSVEYKFDDDQMPIDDGEGGWTSSWEVGNTYVSTISICGTSAEYQVSIMTASIEAISIPETVYIWEGDTYTENGYDTPEGRVEQEWERYGYPIPPIEVTVAGENEPQIVEGDWDEMRVEFAEILGIEPEDVRINIIDDQMPDENGMSSWTATEPGDPYKVGFSVAGIETTFDVYILPFGFTDIEAEKVYRSHDLDLIDDMKGFEDYDDQQEVWYWNEVTEFEGYDISPSKIILTKSDGSTVEFADTEEKCAMDQLYDFRDSYFNGLVESYGIPAEAPLPGIHVGTFSNQSPDENWHEQGYGYYSARIDFGPLESEYTIVLTAEKGNYTGLIVDKELGENDYYYYEDGFFNSAFTDFLEGVVAAAVDKRGNVEKEVPESEGVWYVEKGKADFNRTGLLDFKEETFYIENGRLRPINDFVEFNNNMYFIEDGRVKYGWLEIEGSKYYADETTGIVAKDWNKIGSDWYYFTAEGKMKKGWAEINSSWYYFDSDGIMVTGLQELGGIKYYFTSGGVMKTGWQKIGDIWYYFTKSGAMKVGWEEIGGIWYYFDSDGIMVCDTWMDISGQTYYFSASGAMKIGWAQIDGVWYYFSASGAKSKGWKNIGGTYYYFNEDGTMKTGWFKDGSTWYYLLPSGAMKVGWQKIGQDWYYFKNNGAMAVNTTIDGYKIGPDGRMK